MKRMKFANIILVVSIIITCSLITKAQDEILGRLKDLRPMISTREDVEKLLGKGENRENRTVYHYENETVRVIYSDDDCDEGWYAPKDNIIKIKIRFLNERKLSELTKKVRLKNLRVSQTYDMAGGKVYYDDEKGIEYDVNTLEKKWTAITYYPSNRYASCKCEK